MRTHTRAAETPAHLERVTESRPSHAVSCPHTWSALIYWCASPIKHATVWEREGMMKNADRWIKEAVRVNVHHLGQVHTTTLTKQLWHFCMHYFKQISPIIDYWQDSTISMEQLTICGKQTVNGMLFKRGNCGCFVLITAGVIYQMMEKNIIIRLFLWAFSFLQFHGFLRVVAKALVYYIGVESLKFIVMALILYEI